MINFSHHMNKKLFVDPRECTLEEKYGWLKFWWWMKMTKIRLAIWKWNELYGWNFGNIDEVELWSKILTTTFIDEKWPSSIFVSLRPIYVFFPTSLCRPTFKQIGTTFKHNMQKMCYWKTTPNLHLKFFNFHKWFTKTLKWSN